jgi:hypothetical protein
MTSANRLLSCVDCNRNIRFGTATARSEFLIRDLIFLAESLAVFHRLAFKSARPARPVFWLVSCEKFLFYFLVPVHESCLLLSDFSSAPCFVLFAAGSI